MKQLVFILLVLVTGNVFSQCDIKTNNRLTDQRSNILLLSPSQKLVTMKRDCHYIITSKVKNILLLFFYSIRMVLQQS
jgi:hypothetical protein